MKNASALYHSDQDRRRKGPKIYTKLKAMVTDILEDQQQEAPRFRKETGRVKERVVVLEMQVVGIQRFVPKMRKMCIQGRRPKQKQRR